MALEYAILGFLNERPRSGYDLKTRCFDRIASGFWTADQAQIYRTLDRLQKARLVNATRKRQTGRPDRKVFEITHAGRDALLSWLASPQPIPPARDPFLVQLFFAASLDDDSVLRLLEERREQHTRRIETLRAQSAELAHQHATAPRDEVLKQTALDGALGAEKATLEWLDDCIRAVVERALPGSSGALEQGQRHLFGGSPA